jgi:ribosomal protein L32
MNEYEDMRRVAYDFGDSIGSAVFVPVCETCGRFVKAGTVSANEINGISDEPNAECSKCGPTRMLFEGFF